MKIVYKDIRRFKENIILENSVLIVEPNSYHGEILPGYVRYFITLGYNVSLLVRKEVAQEDPFALFESTKPVNIYSGNAGSIKKALKNENINRYDIIFFSTNVYWELNKNQSSYMEYLGFTPSPRKINLYVEHNLSFIDEDNARTLLHQGRVFTLLEYMVDGRKTKMLNPHYFGEISHKSLSKGKKKILLIGSSSKVKQNTDHLFLTVRAILEKLDTDFVISVAGEKISIPEDLRKYIVNLDRQDFHQYYKTIQKQDFLLTMFDENSESIIHTKYLNGTTSGTIQISLGFLKPMIIDNTHAKYYGFTRLEAVVYEKDLYNGLSEALNISNEEYHRMANAINIKATTIENKSLENLKYTLEDITSKRHFTLINILKTGMRKIKNKHR